VPFCHIQIYDGFQELTAHRADSGPHRHQPQGDVSVSMRSLAVLISASIELIAPPRHMRNCQYFIGSWHRDRRNLMPGVAVPAPPIDEGSAIVEADFALDAGTALDLRPALMNASILRIGADPNRSRHRGSKEGPMRRPVVTICSVTAALICTAAVSIIGFTPVASAADLKINAPPVHAAAACPESRYYSDLLPYPFSGGYGPFCDCNGGRCYVGPPPSYQQASRRNYGFGQYYYGRYGGYYSGD
jgi:hypothetical protein